MPNLVGAEHAGQAAVLGDRLENQDRRVLRDWEAAAALSDLVLVRAKVLSYRLPRSVHPHAPPGAFQMPNVMPLVPKPQTREVAAKQMIGLAIPRVAESLWRSGGRVVKQDDPTAVYK